MSKMLVKIIIFTNFFSDFKMDLNILKIVILFFNNQKGLIKIDNV